jgi:hypothetical protein
VSAGAIAWIDDARGEGCWAPPAELTIPLDDRGLMRNKKKKKRKVVKEKKGEKKRK